MNYHGNTALQEVGKIPAALFEKKNKKPQNHLIWVSTFPRKNNFFQIGIYLFSFNIELCLCTKYRKIPRVILSYSCDWHTNFVGPKSWSNRNLLTIFLCRWFFSLCIDCFNLPSVPNAIIRRFCTTIVSLVWYLSQASTVSTICLLWKMHTIIK